MVKFSLPIKQKRNVIKNEHQLQCILADSDEPQRQLTPFGNSLSNSAVAYTQSNHSSMMPSSFPVHSPTNNYQAQPLAHFNPQYQQMPSSSGGLSMMYTMPTGRLN